MGEITDIPPVSAAPRRRPPTQQPLVYWLGLPTLWHSWHGVRRHQEVFVSRVAQGHVQPWRDPAGIWSITSILHHHGADRNVENISYRPFALNDWLLIARAFNPLKYPDCTLYTWCFQPTCPNIPVWLILKSSWYGLPMIYWRHINILTDNGFTATLQQPIAETKGDPVHRSNNVLLGLSDLIYKYLTQSSFVRAQMFSKTTSAKYVHSFDDKNNKIW